MFWLINNRIQINNVDYEKTKEFTYNGKEYIEISSKKIWDKKILEKINSLEYKMIDDKNLLEEIIKEKYTQLSDVVF